MPDESIFRRAVTNLRKRFLGQEVTVYPTYSYVDPRDAGTWIVPMRVWVHDNRDTPFVERGLERWVTRYFEEDLNRRLEDDERARLEQILEHFIADDKSNEEVEFSFEADPNQHVFSFSKRTSPNGVIEENLRIPAELVERIRGQESVTDPWLKVRARTRDGNGVGEGAIRFLASTGLSVVSDIDDTIKVTHVPAGKKTILRNVFLKEYEAAGGMKARYDQMIVDAGPNADVCFHYVSGSPWQLYWPLEAFLFEQERFPRGTFHLKNLRKNLREAGALDSIRAFALGGDLATLDQKIRQITHLMIHLPGRRFILVGDSGEKDPEVYRAIQRLFPKQVQKIIIRDVLGERLTGMELITGEDIAVFLDTSEVEIEMSKMVKEAIGEPDSPEL